MSSRKKSLRPRAKFQVKKREIPLYAYVEDKATRVANEIGKIIHASPLYKGGVIFIYGPMNSGKTIVGCKLDKLINKKRRFIRAQPDVKRADVLKNYYYSRRGYKCPAISFSKKKQVEQLFDEHEVVIVDEVQFIPHWMQSFFLKEVDEFVTRGGWFIGLSLLYTSQQTEFLLPSLLRQRAVQSYKLTSTCQNCGRRGAEYNQRLVEGRPSKTSDPELVPPSDKVTYESRCEDCLVIYS